MSALQVDISRVIPATRLPGTVRLSDAARRLLGADATTPLIELHPPLRPPSGSVSDSLGPPSSGNPAADNDASHLRAEFKIDGKVMARVYDSGYAETAEGYAHLAELAGFNGAESGATPGPDLADQRIARLTELLRATPSPADDAASGPATSPRPKFSDCTVTLATNLLSQDAWLAEKAKTPGTIVSRQA